MKPKGRPKTIKEDANQALEAQEGEVSPKVTKKANVKSNLSESKTE